MFLNSDLTVSSDFEPKPKSTLLSIIIKLILLIILVPIWVYVFLIGSILLYQTGFESGYYAVLWGGIWIQFPLLAIISNIKTRRRKMKKTSA